VLGDALTGAYTKSQARQEAQHDAECQKSALCRYSDWISLGLGIALAVGCGIATAGVAAVGCFVAAGAVTEVANQSMQNNIHSFDDVLMSAAVGGARGLLDALSGGVGGKVATAIAEKVVSKVGTKVAATLGGALGGATGAGLYDFATTGSVNLGNLALGAAFGAGAGYAGAKLASGKGAKRRGDGDGDATPARRVVEGGRPDGESALAGHGLHRLANGNFIVPDGTEVAVYAPYGRQLDDAAGFRVESGDETMKPVRVYRSGESMPNYTLLPPGDLRIRANSITVTEETKLSDLLEPNMGRCHWAACSLIR
jgi:hypothetical protein